MNLNKVLKHEAKGALFSALPSSREGCRKAVHRKLGSTYRLTGNCLLGPMLCQRVSENSTNKLSLPIVCGHRSWSQLSFMYICPH